MYHELRKTSTSLVSGNVDREKIWHPAPRCEAGTKTYKARTCGRSGLIESVKRGRVIGQDAVADRFVRRPLRPEIEQLGVVRLVLAFSRMRPVGAPHQALWRRLHEGLGGL